MEETDMCLDATRLSSFSQQQSLQRCPAQDLAPDQRRELAVQALAGVGTITQLADDHAISRKFVYQQAAKAEQALHRAFSPDEPPATEVLFWLPVTKPWLEQLTLGVTLICHSSLRGVTELLRDVFDYSISLGTVHNIVSGALGQARIFNERQDLSTVRIGAHDEIFQNGQPVLVGADVASTYCYLLSPEEHRDADTWGVRLLELCDQGFAPEATIADFGQALRAGQEQALAGTTCRGDVFHALQELTALVTYLENRAYEAIADRTRLEHEQAAAERRQGQRCQSLSQRLRHARAAESQAVALAEDMALLVCWLQHDILSVAGPSYHERCALYDFVVAQFQARIALCPHRLKPLGRLLKNQRDSLLAFAAQLDQDLAALAQEFELSPVVMRDLLYVQAMDVRDARRWPKEAALRQRLRGRFYPLQEAVAELARQTVRASSVIENLNSRLRCYFFLRRNVGPDYLALLQFFLNHRRFLRSEHPDRVGKSPAELLTGKPHPHWLELLGYSRFFRN